MKNNILTRLLLQFRNAGNLWNTAVDEIHQWILWIPVFLGIGIGLYFSLSTEPKPYTTPTILLVLVVLTWLLRRRFNIFAPMIVLTTICTGFSAASLRTTIVQHTILDREIGPTRITGQVEKIESRSTGVRVIINNPDIAGLSPHKRPERIRLSVGTRNVQDIAPGDWIRVTGVLRPPQRPAAPGSFDFQRHFYFQGIGATGFSYGDADLIHRPETSGLQTAVQTIRNTLRLQIQSVLEGNTGSIAVALIIGDRGAIPDADVDAMRDSGLAHLLAISGLHVGLIAGFVFFSIRAVLATIPTLALRYPIKAWAAVAGLASAFAYTVLAGAPVPTLRAFTMLAIVFGAIMIGRRGISLRLVAFAATLILLVWPESLLGASFQLSFAAVTGLIAAYEHLNARYRTAWQSAGMGKRIVLYFLGVGFSTIIASLATAPFAAYHFHQLASYGLLSNLIAVPVTAMWIMPAALAGFLLMPFGFEHLALIPMGWGIDVVLATARTFGPLPGNVRAIPAFSTAAIIIMTFGGLWLCLWRRRWRLAGLAPVMVAMALAMHSKPPTIIAADNGQVFGVRIDDNMVMVGPKARGNRFIRTIWLERAGLQLAGEKQSRLLNDEFLCDELGCILSYKGRSIALIWNEMALLEDCWQADLILSSIPVNTGCTQPEAVIDWFDLWRNGAYAVHVTETGEFHIKNTTMSQGHRPWTNTHKTNESSKVRAN